MSALTHSHGSTLTVECSAKSHAEHVAKVATFQESYFDNGQRADIQIVGHVREREGGPDLWSTARDDIVIDPYEEGHVVRHPRRSPVIESAIDWDGRRIADPTTDRSDDSRWHWQCQLTCPLCGFNVSVRREALMDFVGRCLDARLSQVSLTGLGCILTST